MLFEDFNVGDWLCEKTGKYRWSFIVFVKTGENTLQQINYNSKIKQEKVGDYERKQDIWEFVPRFTFDVEDYKKDPDERETLGYYKNGNETICSLKNSFEEIPIGSLFDTDFMSVIFKKIDEKSAICLTGPNKMVGQAYKDFRSNYIFTVYDKIQMKYSEGV